MNIPENLEQVKMQMCDKYCKWCHFDMAQEELDEKCKDCPLANYNVEKPKIYKRFENLKRDCKNRRITDVSVSVFYEREL